MDPAVAVAAAMRHRKAVAALEYVAATSGIGSARLCVSN
jgi:hypothetical protein